MAEQKTGFEPRILGFLCNWCSYAGADLAGVSRIQYPTNLRVVRVMCSGRIEPEFVIEALESGVDGVIITGCHPGDCHYQTGNYQTERRFKALQEAIGYTNIEPERIRLEWVSASEGSRFGEVVSNFTETIRKLGPNKIFLNGKKNQDLLNELSALKNMFSQHSSRTLVGKKGEIVEKGNVYNEKIDIDRYNHFITENIRDGYIRNYILAVTKTTPKSVLEIADKINLDPQKVLNQVSVLRKKNLLALNKIEGTTPKYLSLVQEVDA
jgi:F420-non-reducing hydrogenase iron-sulfur subunit